MDYTTVVNSLYMDAWMDYATVVSSLHMDAWMDYAAINCLGFRVKGGYSMD